MIFAAHIAQHQEILMTRYMSVDDRPVWKDLVFFRIEDDVSATSSRPFLSFEWHGEQIWLIGKMQKFAHISVGYVTLKRPKGKMVYRGEIIANSNRKGEFYIKASRMRGNIDSAKFVFLGFTPSNQVDISFVQQESKRIRALPPSDRMLKKKRPQKGLVV
jgi:hypothetical protein